MSQENMIFPKMASNDMLSKMQLLHIEREFEKIVNYPNLNYPTSYKYKKEVEL